MIPFSCRSWRWNRAIFVSNRRVPLAVERTVAVVTLFGLSGRCLATLTSASRAVIWKVWTTSVTTVLLIVFESEDKITMGCKFHGITFSTVGRIPNMCRLTKLVSRRMTTARMSETRNRNLICRSLVAMWSYSFLKIKIGVLGQMKAILSSLSWWKEASRLECTVSQVDLAVLLYQKDKMMIGWYVAVHQEMLESSTPTFYVQSVLHEIWNYYEVFQY